VGESKTIGQQLRSLLRPKQADPGRASTPQPQPVPALELGLGIDLGTSCTKVVLQDQTTRDAWAVPFEGLPTAGNKYLLVTRLILSEGGLLALTGEGSPVSDLKIRLMGTDLDEVSAGGAGPVSPLELAAAYLALVIDHARRWFADSLQAQRFPGRTVNWHLAIGIPSTSLDGFTERKNFENAVRAAWLVPVKGRSTRLADVREAIRRVTSGSPRPDQLPSEVTSYPEVGAEMMSVRRSDGRRDTLHLLIDVGASTMDVSTFKYSSSDAADRISFFDASVKPLGTYHLHRYRIASLRELIDGLLDPLDPTAAPPGRASDLLPADEECSEIDETFVRWCRRLMSDVLLHTKSRRAPLEPQFTGANDAFLPVYLCGGGSQAALYQDALRRFASSLGPARICPLQIELMLPTPRRFQSTDVQSHDYHRLAVAYGLSCPSGELADVIPPHDMEDLTRLEARRDSIFISKDLV
jgi:hypothetical protein